MLTCGLRGSGRTFDQRFPDTGRGSRHWVVRELDCNGLVPWFGEYERKRCGLAPPLREYARPRRPTTMLGRQGSTRGEGPYGGQSEAGDRSQRATGRSGWEAADERRVTIHKTKPRFGALLNDERWANA